MIQNTHSIVIFPLDRVGTYRVTDRETGQEWIARCRTPFIDTARLLLRLGADPMDRLEMYREGRDTPDLRGTIGSSAKFTVIENEKEGPRFGKYRPLPIDRLNRKAA